MNRALPLLLGLAVVPPVIAQTRSVVPAACEELPGNAALSLPLRWSHGTLQVRINSTLLPANFIGQTISAVRLRRPTFLEEPAYAALQRTLTVRGGFDPRPAALLGNNKQANYPQTQTSPVLFGPTQVSIGAAAAAGPATQTGDEFLNLQFTTPLPVIAGNLFLEFETSDSPLQVSADHWVDAVWFDDGIETGYAVTVGDGSCTTRTVPTELRWNDTATGPVVGGTAAVRLTGAEPNVLANILIGLDPIPRAASAQYVGFGNSLSLLDPALSACHQWTPLDGVLGGVTDSAGGFSSTFDLVAGVATVGLRVGVQSLWLDTSRPGLPISVSNGLMLVVDNISVGDACACAFFPGTAVISPWPTYVGQMPVLVLEHN